MAASYFYLLAVDKPVVTRNSGALPPPGGLPADEAAERTEEEVGLGFQCSTHPDLI